MNGTYRPVKWLQWLGTFVFCLLLLATTAGAVYMLLQDEENHLLFAGMAFVIALFSLFALINIWMARVIINSDSITRKSFFGSRTLFFYEIKGVYLQSIKGTALFLSARDPAANPMVIGTGLDHWDEIVAWAKKRFGEIKP